MPRADPSNYTYVHYSAAMVVSKVGRPHFLRALLVANG